MTTLTKTKSSARSPLRLGFFLIPLALACFALSPQADAVCQEGCFTNQNTVLGEDALVTNLLGSANSAFGFNALGSNTTANNNTAVGVDALGNNDSSGAGTANMNTAVGGEALFFNVDGTRNTACGFNALSSNTTGFANTADGQSALSSNSVGASNVAMGDSAMFSNTIGSNNIALGSNAGGDLTTGDFNIAIGNLGVAGESKRIRIGTRGTQTRTFIAGISGATVPNGVGVIVNSNGQLGTVVSSERFKDAIKPMDKASEAILALKPVTFHYKKEHDPDGIPQFGLVAEDVAKVNPDLVVRDDQGKVYTVRYEAVNAMLLNEFLKEHKKTEKLEATVASLIATVKEQAAQIQKVSAQLEVSKAAPQTVLNRQ